MEQAMTTTNTWTSTTGFTLAATAELAVKIPLVGDAKFSTTATATTSFAIGETKTKTLTIKDRDHVDIP